jgi:RNA polymerase subunit RPABC4/transcription elongation factor Spt4
VRADERALRLAVHFEGQAIEPLFVRDDVRAQFPPTELRQRLEELALKGLGDPQRDEPLYDFGTLDATIRWYDEVLVATFPTGEWSGLLFVFDASRSESTGRSLTEWSGLLFVFDHDESPLADLVGEHLDGD